MEMLGYCGYVLDAPSVDCMLVVRGGGLAQLICPCCTPVPGEGVFFAVVEVVEVTTIL
jgi:hypothetical protein